LRAGRGTNYRRGATKKSLGSMEKEKRAPRRLLVEHEMQTVGKCEGGKEPQKIRQTFTLKEKAKVCTLRRRRRKEPGILSIYQCESKKRGNREEMCNFVYFEDVQN